MLAAIAGTGLLLLEAGCQSPLGSSTDEPSLQQAVAAAVDRELAGLDEDSPTLETTQAPAEVERALTERREELEAIGPATEASRTEVDLGADLTGGEQRRVSVTLRSIMDTAVERNLATRIAKLQPAVNAEDVINARAVFDFLLFASADMDKIDEPTTVPVLGGIQLGTPFDASERYRFETGVRKRFYTGGELSASTDLTRFRNNAPGIGLVPDPAYTAAVRLGLTQPLLRGFGEAVNTATIRLAENTETRAVAQLKTELLDLVEQVEQAYWNLVFAWNELEIRQWLVNEGVDVRDVLDRRREFDTRLAEFSDAVATVESRKADVIRSRRNIRAASDRLKALINDPELTVGSEALLHPAETFVTSSIGYNLREMIVTALSERPEIEQAMLDIDDASIARTVADNVRLPRLDLAAQIAYFGLDEESGESYENLLDAEFIDYILGLRFEYPIGNRGPEAEYRRARLQRSQALLGYRRAVQNVVLDVKASLRDVVTNYELIRATRSNRIAQAENLRALLVEEDTLAGLTPEFLNLKFQRQERLALARTEELLALANFDQAVAGLYRAMGTGLAMQSIDFDAAGAPRAEDLPSGADHAANR
ncbi:MAG: TolC family protein [Planctomycetota bacterium]|nr:TolC family protein [Planctomycetota bacterium]